MAAPSSLTEIGCAPRELLARAAAAIVGRERAHLPDLTHCAVLVQHLHAAADVARALRAAAGVPVLLLPRITTLELWAGAVPLARPVAARAAREAFLYQELQKRRWLASADLWAVSAELAGLFDELTRSSVVLPADFREFNRQLERAYGAKSGASLTFEAQLVHELWHVLAQVGDELDPASAYQLGLARIADSASAPLYALNLARLAPGEQRFLERYAERAPVTVFRADREEAADAVARTLSAAWPPEADRPGLLDRARELAASHPRSALVGRVRMIGAASAEQEAQAVDVTVREWLLAGRQRIAVVVQDRLVARRARALLERGQVLVKDEAGWAFSTTSAATAIGRWLDVASGDCYYRDLLDLMKSPFAFHDWAREARRAAVLRLEGYVRKENVISGLDHFIELAEAKKDHQVRQMLARIRQGINALGHGRRRTIPRWLAALTASLDEIGLLGGLADDSAGAQLLDLVGRLGDELAAGTLAVDFSEWRRWLARQLEGATFRDRAIESPVAFTSLAATRLRAFDAVLILGADAAHLPGPDPAAMFFSQGVRAELKLPTWSERVKEMEEDLAALIDSCGEVAVTWQRMAGGEDNLLSPIFERLAALHELAYEAHLEDVALVTRLARADVHPAGAALPVEETRAPAPSAGPLLPDRISASAYNSLVACPYQYYARYVLGLGELDEVEEEIQKRDYGSLLHDVLTKFHRAHPATAAMDPAAAQRELEALSDVAFAPIVARNYFARAWLARWKGLIPDYLRWQREREASGWVWSAGEVSRSIEIKTPKGATITLHGRLDRVDRSEDRSPVFAVIDYKARAVKPLQDSLQAPGEDVQLAVYALLWGDAVSEAMFLSVDRGEVKAVPSEDIQTLAQATSARLAVMFGSLAAGASLRAQGTEAACEYCDVRGLCRKDHWHD
jgi:ATP-dependent helicase/nuclease subunit B